MQKRLFDIGWSDERICQACHKEEGTEKHRLIRCPEWYEVRREIPKAFKTWEQKAKTSKKEWKWQRGIVEHPPSASQWNRGQFSMKKLESEKHKSWGIPAEGFNQGLRCNRRLSSGYGWKVASMWLVSGAIGL